MLTFVLDHGYNIPKDWRMRIASRQAQTDAGPVIRCSDCGGTVIWKKTTEGYEVIHCCVNGKQARAAAERMSCGHIKADWVERPRTCGPSENCDCKTHGYCRTCAAIASAEARARLEEHLHYCDRCMLATPKDYCYRGKELYAAARTPDSTKEQG